MYKALVSIDGDTAEDNVIEAYTDGTLWNGWTSVCMTREQVSEWLNASPYDYRFLADGTLVIAYDDRTEQIESTPLPTDDGQILEGYFMDGYCFVELAQL